MHTTLFLVRAGDTEWERAGRLLGRRDVGLSDVGRAQAEHVAALLAGVEIAEVLSSPLLRAAETAEPIARPHRIELARDQRLIDLDLGEWEGLTPQQLEGDEAWRRFVRAPAANPPPGADTLPSLRDRVLSSVEQALGDNHFGSNIVVVGHESGLRALLAHHLGDLAAWPRIALVAGAVTVLRFASDREPPRLLALNLAAPLRDVLAESS